MPGRTRYCRVHTPQRHSRGVRLCSLQIIWPDGPYGLSSYLGYPQAPKRKIIPKIMITIKKSSRSLKPRQALACAVSANILYAKMTAGLYKDPSKNVSKDTSTEDVTVLLSVITSINIGELTLLAKNSRLSRIPWKKLLF
ncbi:hypothetical protein EVAR_54589_1 [Eumeta japonica]|uniref:Uncharacterized protein n=1 Tax=Eumeta variegata TaxID=151549 RepID=A0A4C1YKH9_EUMVA|nr:hypothetical protein EVAR_54589_1 [Eumeta japonica]